MGSGAAGELTAVGSLVGGTGLAWGAGWLVDRLAARGDRAGPLTVGTGLCVALALLAGCAVLLLSDGAAVALWLCVYSLLAVPTVLGGTAFQLVTAPRLRAQVMAVHLLLMNVLALSLGPFLVAFLTDHVLGRAERVHQSLAIVDVAAALLGALCFIAVRRRFRQAAAADEAGRGA
jgi:hypothetical protein